MRGGLIVLYCMLFNTAVLLAQGVNPPQVQFVSINPYTNNISIAWSKSSNTNISFIRIHYVYDKIPPIKGQTVNDIYANNNDTLTFSVFDFPVFSSQPQDEPLSFAVDAYTVGNESSATLDEFHTTSILSHSIVECRGGVHLQWTPYEAYNAEVTQTSIVEVLHDDTELVIETVNESDTQFVVPYNQLAQRRFFIRTFMQHQNSQEYVITSNMVTAVSPVFSYPNYLYIDSLLVDTAQQVSLHVKTDVDSDFSLFLVERSLSSAADFVAYDTVDVQGKSRFVYKDSAAISTNSMFYYRITALDNCLEHIRKSNYVAPISLFIDDAAPAENSISWSFLQNVVESVINSMTLYRITNVNDSEQIAQIAEADGSWRDAIENLAIDPQVCYYITARLQDTLTVFISSLYACVLKESSLFVPTAFNPKSAIEENRVFKPKYAFVAGTYVMQIFSRSGGKIFESFDIEKGWDGTVSGAYVPEGVYQYAIKIVLPNGSKIHENGLVKLLIQE